MSIINVIHRDHHPNVDYKEYWCQSRSDINDLPGATSAYPDPAGYGSIAHVREDGSEWILERDDLWHELPSPAYMIDLFDGAGSLPHLLTINGTATVTQTSIGGLATISRQLYDGDALFYGDEFTVTATGTVNITGATLRGAAYRVDTGFVNKTGNPVVVTIS